MEVSESEAPLPKETVYRLLWELYAGFIELCEQILREFPVTPKEIKKRYQHDYASSKDEISPYMKLVVLGELIYEKVSNAESERLFEDKYGMDSLSFAHLLEKVCCFRSGWGKRRTYEEARKEKRGEEDELPFVLLDYTKDERGLA